MATVETPNPGQTSIPFYRDIRVLNILIQLGFAVLILGGFALASYSLYWNFNDSGQNIDFGVYQRPFGPALSEGVSASAVWGWMEDPEALERLVWIVMGIAAVLSVAGLVVYRGNRNRMITLGGILALLLILLVVYPPASIATDLVELLPKFLYPNSITRAIITGISNTLRVVVISIVASTLLGIVLGIALLSRNFLARNMATIFVEIFRNTPLYLQLIFIYSTLSQIVLPVPRQSIYNPKEIFGISLFQNNLYAANKRGVYLVDVSGTDKANIFYFALLLALVVGWGLRRWRLSVQERTGAPALTWYYVIPAVVALPVVGWLIAGEPFTYAYPVLEGTNIQGGTALSIAFFSVCLGLVFYTSAFIADIVRAGIQAVPFGQIEAARSQGLKGSQVLGLVVLPQALRLILPPLGNQYVNLGKNSSLAIVVGFVDLFRAVQLANNESGQSIPLFLGVMLLYLILSLTLSLLTNLFNQVTQIKTR